MTRAGIRAGSLAVVVPTLDEAEALPGLLARLAAGALRDRPDELVVADGGSSDATVALAAAAGAAVVRAPRGRGAQLARGVAATTSDLVLVLHADSAPAPDALAALRAALAQEPGWVAAGMTQRIDAEGAFYRLVERAANARTARGIVYGDSGLCVRRAAYDAAGGFRDLPIFEDVDLSRRLRRLGRVGRVREARLSISARRWRREGALRCTARNWMLRFLHAAGVAPARLARWYPSPAPPHGSDPARTLDPR